MERKSSKSYFPQSLVAHCQVHIKILVQKKSQDVHARKQLKFENIMNETSNLTWYIQPLVTYTHPNLTTNLKD